MSNNQKITNQPAQNDSIANVFIALRSTLARAVSRLVPPKEVEDIVQETYVRVCQVDAPEQIQFPRSFMLRTAQNLALDHLKRAETRLSVSLDDELDLEVAGYTTRADDTFDRVAANQEFGFFCEAVRQLPQQCRKAFVLKKVYGYTQKEIALSLNISENTVEKHIATGIKRCAQYMASLKQGGDSLSTTLPKAPSERSKS
ncbi:putative RNA polymerase sigma-70 factor FecI [Cellvibrio sp. BR]|jgi:RNA polymerase sigma factor (sigma-70 family)|uniref:RNA polymerase sigma factor n=1 Tax=unclassified Cellvibrio TaxID=2624793 RepID=UPI0002601093|nr:MULTISPECIES: sigma-70 family RNA polymerase sigma factor [unclassified Cellvibrio]EIK46062.1 putative RNA polymerase sigma-70 factor FecI [Cellvibrio sp. BR]UUA71996.1 sigma-70 family RNA polymerase sigma factor [Cellvibrio sp. QJXJ]